ncbi:LysR family transcriptional regulator [Dyella sedimenti]|uniref:LysR family transcriptional regulator n=1 Tax=Dyella sedimenti TaxID=2919947 RepID=UPI001FA9CFD7|nr:LysR family transcriptional regulator [Dyella sedimenti]
MNERADASVAEIVAFTAVAQTGSFTRAAENLATSKSNVGKAVQRLEARLGTKLFQRTTRAVHLTEDGEIYLQASQAALAGLRDAEQALAARRAEPIGKVRVDLPAGFGRLFLATLAELRERHPLISLELAFSDRMSDPVAEGWDIVVRIGELPPDSDMVVRKLCQLSNGLYAAPSYLARKGEVAAVADLSTHDAAIFRASSGRLRPWSVKDGSTVREIAPSPALVVADGQALIDATVQGFGISQIFDRVARPLVDSGRLVHVLPDADVPGPPVHALIPLGHRMPSRTRVVLEQLVAFLR